MVGEHLLGDVEILREQRASTPEVAAGPHTETPATRLEVALEPVQDGQGPADHAGVRASGRQLGDEREVADLAADDAQGLPDVLPGHRPDTGA